MLCCRLQILYIIAPLHGIACVPLASRQLPAVQVPDVAWSWFDRARREKLRQKAEEEDARSYEEQQEELKRVHALAAARVKASSGGARPHSAAA